APRTPPPAVREHDGVQLPLSKTGAALVLFRAVLDDEPAGALLALLDALARPRPDPDAVRASYGRLFGLLAERTELDTAALPGDAWQAHVLERLLHDENAFSRKAQRAPLAAMGPALVEQARRDLRLLQRLHALSAAELAALAGQACGEAAPLPRWDELRPLGHGPVPAVVE